MSDKIDGWVLQARSTQGEGPVLYETMPDDPRDVVGVPMLTQDLDRALVYSNVATANAGAQRVLDVLRRIYVGEIEVSPQPVRRRLELVRL